jgi:hypothetical protein
VSFSTEQGGQYVVFASSVDAPGLGDYTLNTTVTGTPVANPLRSASADTLLPLPVFNQKNPPQTYNLTYAPLDGGNVSPIQIKDINQRGFGDCYFLAAMTSTFGKIENVSDANSKKSTVLDSAISTDGNNYTINFFDDGKPQKITVDNNVVTDEGVLFSVKWTNEAVKPTAAKDQPIWAPIFERAYAKFRGGYDAIGNGGFYGNALSRLTNKAIDHIKWKSSDLTQEGTTVTIIPSSDRETGYSYFPGTPIKTDLVFNSIKTALDEGGYVAAGTPGGGDDSKLLYGGVLYQSHAYSVHNAYEKDGQKLILLRNPHGVDNTNGENRTAAKAAEDPSNDNDGFITITFDAFLKNFDGVSLSKP